MNISQNFDTSKEICRQTANDQMSAETEKNKWCFFHHMLVKTIDIIELAGIAYTKNFHVSKDGATSSNKKKRMVATSQAQPIDKNVIMVLFLVVNKCRFGFSAIISFTVRPKISAMWEVTGRSGRPSPRSHLDIDLSE